MLHVYCLGILTCWSTAAWYFEINLILWYGLVIIEFLCFIYLFLHVCSSIQCWTSHGSSINLLCVFLFAGKLANKKLMFNVRKGIIINIGIVILVLLLKQLYIFILNFCILHYNSIITRHFLFCLTFLVIITKENILIIHIFPQIV